MTDIATIIIILVGVSAILFELIRPHRNVRRLETKLANVERDLNITQGRLNALKYIVQEHHMKIGDIEDAQPTPIEAAETAPVRKIAHGGGPSEWEKPELLGRIIRHV